METFLGILEETPWWVYLLFIYLVFMGIKALSPRFVPIKKLIILPAVFTVWGALGLQWGLGTLLFWLIALAAGCGLGWISVRRWKIRFDRRRDALHLPGSPSTLILALLFFSVKYFFGYYSATQPEIPDGMRLAQAAVSGLLAGMFIGRLFFFWKKHEED